MICVLNNEVSLEKYMKFLILISLILSLFNPSEVHANGALAIDGNQGSQYGFAVGMRSMAEAHHIAKQECGAGCYIVKTFSTGCAAYAADQASGSTIYGWATGSSSGQVKNGALKFCRNRGGTNCIVRAWGCN